MHDGDFLQILFLYRNFSDILFFSTLWKVYKPSVVFIIIKANPSLHTLMNAISCVLFFLDNNFNTIHLFHLFTSIWRTSFQETSKINGCSNQALLSDHKIGQIVRLSGKRFCSLFRSFKLRLDFFIYSGIHSIRERT